MAKPYSMDLHGRHVDAGSGGTVWRVEQQCDHMGPPPARNRQRGAIANRRTYAVSNASACVPTHLIGFNFTRNTVSSQFFCAGWSWAGRLTTRATPCLKGLPRQWLPQPASCRTTVPTQSVAPDRNFGRSHFPCPDRSPNNAASRDHRWSPDSVTFSRSPSLRTSKVSSTFRPTGS